MRPHLAACAEVVRLSSKEVQTSVYVFYKDTCPLPLHVHKQIYVRSLAADLFYTLVGEDAGRRPVGRYIVDFYCSAAKLVNILIDNAVKYADNGEKYFDKKY